ncbi:MAG: O-antigen ligase domain-containing protein [Crocosphaera sp.]|nr:O-antigen ligase domain-containing protein [Crocosphaera sp.]
MSPQAQIIILLWLPIVTFIFINFSPRKAVIISFLVAWLFLPQRAGFSFPGIPDYTRISATCYSILFLTFIFDFRRIQTFKFNWLDLPMLILCISPFFSSTTNGLGSYDGLSETLSQTVRFGLPYFLGRIYLNNLLGLNQLAKSIFISGLIYMPLCLYETRMSPQLHRIVYGYFAHSFAQTIRYGGFRPTVFMIHGLEVGMWMMAVTLIAIWLWQAKVIKKVGPLPMTGIVMALIITLILVKSTGAYLYFIYGLIILFFAKKIRNSLPLLILVIALSSYLFFASTGNVTIQAAEPVLSAISSNISEARAQSLQFRLENEELLAAKALEKPVFGWGGWSRSRVYDYNWEGELVDISVTDSLWIIIYGRNGMVGLVSLYAAFFIPVCIFTLKRYPAKFWFHPQVAPTACLAVVITLYMLDNTLNALFNPIFVLICGGITGLVIQVPKHRKRLKNFPVKTKELSLKTVKNL